MKKKKKRGGEEEVVDEKRFVRSAAQASDANFLKTKNVS